MTIIVNPTIPVRYYTTKAPEYYTTSYATPSYYTEAPKYYTTKAPEYYTTTYAAPSYYTEAPKGNTNKGSSFWVSPEGQKFTLTWTADDAGFQPKGDHFPVAPVHEYELPVAPVHEYELPVAPVHFPFNGKGYKIY
ncbi:uncharacterized protein LOC123474189 [Daphnia magna]|uniref:uncharacterized protein LOC123474189 n=1 Tax=Daphnia magna TaxID=35525 RepID=UPI001E1BA894|nr:uncharacterized protein LOC123474189 [Daphnia magna]